ncbi:hypothetical protein Forpe1208_v007854 [Fusarium oxysporum f. sp. rapae]|uniref:Uncharacterized protein n=1 Tax=Fusarium oxysporum f. sp. rapae TaxID=485398 RepID=A0A8J5TWV0_FUSOX|nr:hypothetical protein Forpe1208_v007854 [Fusarium oxysporum f. sp. rapae]
MATNNRKNNQPEILGAVSKGSIRFNSQAASLPEKRGQSPVTDQSSVTKKSKSSNPNTPTLQPHPSIVLETSTTRSQGGHNLGFRESSATSSTEPSGAFGTSSVASTTVPSGVKPLPAGGPSNTGLLPSEDLRPHRSLSGSFEDKNQKRVSSGGFSSAPKVSPDAGVTHALSSEDEFSDLDMGDLDEVGFQQLESQVLGQASIVGEDDGPSTRENEVVEFLDSDLNDLGAG